MLGRNLVAAVGSKSSRVVVLGSSSRACRSRSSNSSLARMALAGSSFSSSSSFYGWKGDQQYSYSTSVYRCNDTSSSKSEFVTMNGEEYSEEEVRKMMEEEMARATLMEYECSQGDYTFFSDRYGRTHKVGYRPIQAVLRY